MNYNTAIILCGGKGTRLGQLGKKLPKTLIKIQGKPILWYIIKFLEKNSFNHFILPVGHKGKMIQRYFKSNIDFKKSKIDIIKTGINSTIAQRIFKIKDKIKSKNFILLNGDAVFNFNIKKVFRNHKKKGIFTTFLGSEAQLSYGIVGLSNGKVQSFKRDSNFYAVKLKNQKNFMGYVYSGIAIIRTSLLKIKFKKFENFEKEFYPEIIKNFKSDFKSIDGFWHSVDNQKDLEFFKKSHNKSIYKSIVKLRKHLIK